MPLTSQSEVNELYRLIKEARLFDEKAYLLANKEVAEQGIDPLRHYIDSGQHKPSCKPYAEFDGQQYLTDFRIESVKGNPFFDLVRRSVYKPIASEPILSPFEIYIYNLIQHFGLFDEDYYLRKNSDINKIHLSPLVHYVRYGIHERARNPNRKYNNEAYVRSFDGNFSPIEPPFLHYIRHNLDMDFIDKGLLSRFDRDFLQRVTRRLYRLPFYSDTDYLSINRDVEDSDLLPHHHAVLYGIPEGRTIFSNIQIAKTLGKKASSTPTYSPNAKVGDRPILPETIGVFYHTSGNSFIREIAGNLVDYMTAAGLNASLETEKTSSKAKPDLCVFCAPHEFFFLDGVEDWQTSDIIRNSVMFNTEQPQTIWFSRGLLYILASAGIIDLLYQDVALFESTGLPSFHFDPVPSAVPTRIFDEDRSHAFFRAMPDAAKVDVSNATFHSIADRGIDISFFGNHSERREKFFANSAKFLSKKNCFIYYRKQNTPIQQGGVNQILSRIPFYVAENSKICLNVHRNNDPYFEWHRIVAQGAARGAVVVTEECLPTPLYQEGVHFLAETPRHMPHLIAWLLDTPDGRARAQDIQTACLKLFENKELRQSKLNDIRNYVATIWQRIVSNVQ
ncbi:hypothetical protein [Labrys neptuniae]